MAYHPPHARQAHHPYGRVMMKEDTSDPHSGRLPAASLESRVFSGNVSRHRTCSRRRQPTFQLGGFMTRMKTQAWAALVASSMLASTMGIGAAERPQLTDPIKKAAKTLAVQRNASAHDPAPSFRPSR